MAQPLAYALQLSNAAFIGPANQSRAAIKGIGTDASAASTAVQGMKVKFDGLSTATTNTSASFSGLFDKAAHIGGNLANIVSGVKAANEAITWLRQRSQTAAPAVATVGIATGKAAGTSRLLGSSGRMAGAGLGFLGAAAGGAALGVAALATAALPIVAILGAIRVAFAGVSKIGEGVMMAAEMEKTQVAFTALLGSASRADSVLAAVKQTATETGEAFGELTKASQTLLAARIPEGALSGELKALSTIAKVSGGDLNGIVKAYAQVAGAGRVMGDELEQFVEQGAGAIKAEMAAVLGVTQAQFRDLTQEGKVGFSVLQQAVQNLGGATGKWASAMGAAKGTTLGMMAQLKANIASVFMAIGQPIKTGALDAFLQRAVAASSTVAAVVRAAIANGQIGETLKNALTLGVKLGVNNVISLIETLPSRLMGVFSTIGQAVAAALSGSFEEAKKLLGSFKLSERRFDTSGELAFFDKLIAKGKELAKPLDQAADKWANALDAIEAPKADKPAAGGRAMQQPEKPTADTNGDGIVSRREQRKWDLAQWRAERRANAIKGGVSGGFTGLSDWTRSMFTLDKVKVRGPLQPPTPMIDAWREKMKLPIGAKLETPGNLTRKQRLEEARKEAERQGKPRWDLVASIDGTLTKLAVA